MIIVTKICILILGSLILINIIRLGVMIAMRDTGKIELDAKLGLEIMAYIILDAIIIVSLYERLD